MTGRLTWPLGQTADTAITPCRQLSLSRMPSCCRSTLTFGASGPGMSRFQYAILPRSMPMSVIMPVRRVLRIRAPVSLVMVALCKP